jgi:prevent-host-death family protein
MLGNRVAAARDTLDDQASTVPIGTLGKGSRLVRQVAETGKPTVVTDNGVQVAVILDVVAYEALRRGGDGGDLRRTLLAALQEVEAGKLVDDDEVMAALRVEFADFVPPDALTELTRA